MAGGLPTDVDSLPPTEYLILEVLAARSRLGEQLWTFPNQPRLVAAAHVLARRGLIGVKGGVAPASIQAWLTDAGRSAALSDRYEPPISRGDLPEGQQPRDCGALCRDVEEDRDRLAAEVERLREDRAKLTATIAAFPDAHNAANLAHARMERDRLRAEVAQVRADVAATAPAAVDAAFLARKREFSARTFGPQALSGVIDHIRKELVEVEADPSDLGEWVDVIMLSLDGAWRAGHEPQEIVDAIVAKQARNEARTWPDWRTTDPGKAIEHDRRAAESVVGAPTPAAVASDLDGACHSVWLHGKWRWLTSQMTTPEKEAFADAVDRAGDVLADGEDRLPVDRWWREPVGALPEDEGTRQDGLIDVEE